MSELPACKNTVAINFPCQYDEGHIGVCQPNTERQLRIYGVELEDIRRIAQDLRDARVLGIADGSGKRTTFGRYIVLKAALNRLLDRCRERRGHGALVVLYPSDLEEAMKQAEADCERWETSEARLRSIPSTGCSCPGGDSCGGFRCG